MRAFHRKYGVLFLKFLISCAILGFIVHAGWLDLARSAMLLQAPDLLFLTFAGIAINLVLGTFRWLILLRALGIEASFSECVFPNYLAMALNPILPGRVGGDVVRLGYVLKRYEAYRAQAVTSVFVDRVIGFFGMLLLGFAMLPARLDAIANGLRIPSTSFSQLAVACVFIVVTILAAYLVFNRWSGALSERYPGVTRFMTELWHSLGQYKRKPAALIACTLLTIALHAVTAVVIWYLAGSLGFIDISLGDIVLASTLMQIVTLLPLTPGGLGISEGGFAIVLLLLHPDGGATFYGNIYFSYRLLSLAVMLPAMVCFRWDFKNSQ